MTMHAKPTWDQVLTAKHWHPCDLGTHTIAQCSADARHQHAIGWGADVLSFCAVYAVLFSIVRPIERALARRTATAVLPTAGAAQTVTSAPPRK
jgi:hypothetical protein